MNEAIKTYDVVIPFYSRKDWLEEAIDSILAQTLRPNLVIVVDDGSKEDTTDLIEKYKGEINFFRKENGGAASARNLGIKNCTGDVIFFLDSDDIWLPSKAEKQISMMNELNLMWSATAYKTFGEKKERIVIPYESESLIWQHLYNSCSIQTSNVAVRRSYFRSKDDYFAVDMRNGQDIYVWFRLAQHYPLGVIKEPLVLFRIRGTNTKFSYVAHVRVRAMLWQKMNLGLLNLPQSRLTKAGYLICNRIYEKYDGNIPEKKMIKMQFVIAWLIFRISNLYVK